MQKIYSKVTDKLDFFQGIDPTELAEKYGVKMQEIVLSWLWTKGVASPIVGAIDRNPPQGVMLLDEKK